MLNQTAIDFRVFVIPKDGVYQAISYRKTQRAGEGSDITEEGAIAAALEDSAKNIRGLMGPQ